MKEQLQNYVNKLPSLFITLPETRKNLLQDLIHFIQDKKNNNQEINLLFICTHNSRRSHFAQIWAKVAAHYYKISQVNTFSGGTEATAFNEFAIKSLVTDGFEITAQDETSNPVQLVDWEEGQIKVFSKTIDHSENPTTNFGAIFTCNEADKACPTVNGADFRIALAYDDPKKFDGTIYQNRKYDERSKQIATELFYVFSMIK